MCDSAIVDFVAVIIRVLPMKVYFTIYTLTNELSHLVSTQFDKFMFSLSCSLHIYYVFSDHPVCHSYIISPILIHFWLYTGVLSTSHLPDKFVSSNMVMGFIMYMCNLYWKFAYFSDQHHSHKYMCGLFVNIIAFRTSASGKTMQTNCLWAAYKTILIKHCNNNNNWTFCDKLWILTSWIGRKLPVSILNWQNFFSLKNVKHYKMNMSISSKLNIGHVKYL